MTRRNVQKQECVFPLFSPDSDDRLSLNVHMFVILYICCNICCNTRSVGLGQYSLPKVSNGFKKTSTLERCTKIVRNTEPVCSKPHQMFYKYFCKLFSENLREIYIQISYNFLLTRSHHISQRNSKTIFYLIPGSLKFN